MFHKLSETKSEFNSISLNLNRILLNFDRCRIQFKEFIIHGCSSSARTEQNRIERKMFLTVIILLLFSSKKVSTIEHL